MNILIRTNATVSADETDSGGDKVILTVKWKVVIRQKIDICGIKYPLIQIPVGNNSYR